MRMVLCLLLILSVLPFAVASQTQSHDPELQAKARQILTGLQPRSFRTGREYCGLLGRDRNGRLVTGPIQRGGLDGCAPHGFTRDDVEPLASFHTHAAYDHDADSEVPSYDDLRADMDEDLVGFIATPGGRFWMTIPAQSRVVQICGLNCLPQDRYFQPGDWGLIHKSYTLRQLKQRQQLY